MMSTSSCSTHGTKSRSGSSGVSGKSSEIPEPHLRKPANTARPISLGMPFAASAPTNCSCVSPGRRLRAYLVHRRALGFQLKCEGQQLRNFACYADQLGHRDPLTNRLAIGWACLPKAANRLYWARRLEIVRTFARHLVITEPKTQIPPRHLFGPAHRRPSPHLYSPAQVQQLLRRAGTLIERPTLAPPMADLDRLVGMHGPTNLRSRASEPK